MLDRVGSYASDLLNTQQILQQKSQLDDTLQQTTSGKVSPDYAGVSNVAENALELSNQNSSITNFNTDNQVVGVTLNTMQTVYSSMNTTMQQFQQQLENYIDNSEQTSSQDTSNLQAFAFQALKNMEYYLNTQVGGQYIFGGSNTNQPPVSVPGGDTLTSFQQTFDGYNVTFPTSRSADLANVTTNVLNTGGFTFNDQTGTITASNTGQFGAIPVGAAITVGGSGTPDGTYTVLSNNGTQISVSRNMVGEGQVSITDNTNPGTAITSSQTSLTFNPSGVISATLGTAFANIQAGDSITISGATNSANNGTFTVASVNATDGTMTLSLPGASSVVAETEPPTITVATAADAPTDPGVTVSNPMIFTAPGVITTTVPGAFSGLSQGDSINISGSANAANNGSFVISSIDSAQNTITIERPDFSVAATNIAAATGDTSATVSFQTGAVTSTDSNGATDGGLTFTAPTASADATIADPGSTGLDNVLVGTYVTVANAANSANNGTYLVTGNNSGTLSVRSISQSSLVNEAANASAVISNSTATVFNPGSLAFSAAGGTVIAATAGSLSKLAVDQTINISNTNYNNGPLVVTGTYNQAVTSETDAAGVSIVANGGTNPITGASTAVTTANAITFSAATGTPSTLVGSSADLGNFNAGDVLTLSGTTGNNGQFVVTGTSTAGGITTITLAPPGTAVQVAKNESISTASYFQGNTETATQNIDANTPLSFGITASDPAFEKAMRAMGLIAQGVQGTAGGLDMNFGRLQSADYLITSAIDNSQQGNPATGTLQSGAPPSGTVELSDNMNVLQRDLDLQQQTMSNVTNQETATQNLDQTSVDNMLNSDPTQTIVKLLDQQAALEASYQALSTVRQTSLLNYLK